MLSLMGPSVGWLLRIFSSTPRISRTTNSIFSISASAYLFFIVIKSSEANIQSVVPSLVAWHQHEGVPGLVRELSLALEQGLIEGAVGA